MGDVVNDAVVVPKGRRVVTVPAWVPGGWIWRGMCAIGFVAVSLIVSNVIAWKVQDEKSCEAIHRSTLDVAASVMHARSDFPDDPGVRKGLATIAQRIRGEAESC